MLKRQLREVIIAPSVESAKQRKRTGHNILISIREVGIEGVVVARRLPSGDIMVTAENKERKEIVEKD